MFLSRTNLPRFMASTVITSACSADRAKKSGRMSPRAFLIAPFHAFCNLSSILAPLEATSTLSLRTARSRKLGSKKNAPTFCMVLICGCFGWALLILPIDWITACACCPAGVSTGVTRRYLISPEARSNVPSRLPVADFTCSDL